MQLSDKTLTSHITYFKYICKIVIVSVHSFSLIGAKEGNVPDGAKSFIQKIALHFTETYENKAMCCKSPNYSQYMKHASPLSLIDSLECISEDPCAPCRIAVDPEDVRGTFPTNGHK
jgi:hypothetical protein